MPTAPGKLGSAALTKELRKLAGEVVDMGEDGTPITRETLLAQMIWRQALGWVEVTRDDDGNRKEVKHPPIPWCQQFLYERVEGKAQQAVAEDHGGIRAAEKVRELAKDRINALAKIAVGPPKAKG